MESKCNEEMSNNSLTDWLKGLMCDEDDDDYMGSGSGRMGADMCEQLDEFMCKKAMKRGCVMKNGVCYKKKVEPTRIVYMSDFLDLCRDLDECKGICALTKVSKKDKKDGVQPLCDPSKKVHKNGKVKCKKFKDQET